jgi:threonine dehydrogenase-like Zn-dependent dehydrogenase
VRPYQKALVIGDGFMGQLFAQIVQAYGVHQVDLAGIFDEKLERNQKLFGVKEIYNTTREDIPEDSYDVIIEAWAFRRRRLRQSRQPRRALRC